MGVLITLGIGAIFAGIGFLCQYLARSGRKEPMTNEWDPSKWTYHKTYGKELEWFTNFPEGSIGFSRESAFMRVVDELSELGYGRMIQMIQHAWDKSEGK